LNGIKTNIGSSLNRVAIVTHVFATGPAQELEEYLKEKVDFLLFIGHPFSYAPDTRSFFNIYNGGIVEKKTAFRWKLPEVLIYFKDVLYTLCWTIKCPKTFDLYIGADPLNAFSGIILKTIGKVKRVVFYTIDYVPKRFNSRVLNWIYHKIDKFCAEHSDYVWNLSERMIVARKKYGVKMTNNQMVVPVGVRLERIKRLDIGQINRNHLVYMGHLRKNQGLQLLIDSLPVVIAKNPNIKLIIIGTGELEQYLKNKVRELNLMVHVEFKGYIENHKDVEDILSTCGVGLSLYEPHQDSFTWYTDPGKPKQYLACGLPVIITKVPWIAEKIERMPMGIAINYDQEELVKAITKLMTDNEFYKKCRENAIGYVSGLSWDKIFNEALIKSAELTMAPI